MSDEVRLLLHICISWRWERSYEGLDSMYDGKIDDLHMMGCGVGGVS